MMNLLSFICPLHPGSPWFPAAEAAVKQVGNCKEIFHIEKTKATGRLQHPEWPESIRCPHMNFDRGRELQPERREKFDPFFTVPWALQRIASPTLMLQAATPTPSAEPRPAPAAWPDVGERGSGRVLQGPSLKQRRALERGMDRERGKGKDEHVHQQG
ncbi:hypothetical protein AOLI_G00294270 [Acnodon oligacanthus]